DAAAAAAMFDAFHGVHDRNYGYSYRGKQQIEVVNLRVTGFGHLRPLRPTPPGGTTGKGPQTVRRAFFAEDGFRDTPVYRRGDLAVGSELAGPGIVEQYDTTTVILPGQRAQV